MRRECLLWLGELKFGLWIVGPWFLRNVGPVTLGTGVFCLLRRQKK